MASVSGTKRTGAQRAKVRTRLGADVAAQLESDAASTTVPDADLEVHLLPRHVSKLASALATSVQLFVYAMQELPLFLTSG